MVMLVEWLRCDVMEVLELSVDGDEDDDGILPFSKE